MFVKVSKKNGKTKDKQKDKKDKKKDKDKDDRNKKASEKFFFYHNDHLGMPQKLTDATGTIVWAADYLPFGQATITVEDIENSLRFTGQYYDAETGLHYNYHRYYDPATGRYLTTDPIGLEGGINPYVYVENNPGNFVDPYGLEVLGPMTGTVIVNQNGVKIEHYGTADHGPAHAHVKEGGPETKIGPKGYPLKNQPSLTAKQKRVWGQVLKC